MGRRVWETRNGDFRTWPREAKQPLVTDIYLPEQVAKDFRIWLGGMAHLEFMRDRGWIRIHELEDGQTVEIGGVTVRPFRLSEDYVYAFELSDGDRRLLVAMDELNGWSPPPEVKGCDLAVLPMGICEFDLFTGERLIHEEHPVLRFEATFEETLASSPSSMPAGWCSATSRRWTASPTTSCSRSSDGSRPRARTSASPGTAARSTCERVSPQWWRCPAR